MTDIDIRVDARDALKMLAQCEKQIGFAASRAVTKLAYEGQKAVRASLPQHFHIRNDGTSKAIKVQPAARKSGLDAEAIVYVGALGGRDFNDWMERQETGGVKTPTSGHSLAIPKDVRASVMEILKRAQRPRALLKGYNKEVKQKKKKVARYRVPSKPFIIKDKNGKLYVATRLEAKRPYTQHLRIFYRFISKIETPKRLAFRENTLKVARDKLGEVFGAELEAAFRKARTLSGVVTVRK